MHFARTITVLSVDPIASDHASLRQIFSHSSWSTCPESQWNLTASDTAASALETARTGQVPVLLCGCDHQPDVWKEILAELAEMDRPPLLIVTSRMADERLWAEALNLGAYDVLAKPFDQSEVTRVISSAWRHWKEQRNSVRAEVISAAGGVS